MKKFITLISAVLVLGAVATASTGLDSKIGLSTQKSISSKSMDTNYCDAIEQILGLCRISQPFSFEN